MDGSMVEPTEKEIDEVADVEATAAQPEEPAAAEAEVDITADLRRLEDELERATDLRLRLAADFDNYRKRVERERADQYHRAQSDLAKQLLNAIDDLDRISEFGEDTPVRAMLEGVQLVEKKFLTILGNAGLEEVMAANQPFDPNTMEAVAVVATEDPAQDGIVSDVFQKGWLFKGQLLRPARVRVMQCGI